jgi:hypothetical protein
MMPIEALPPLCILRTYCYYSDLLRAEQMRVQMLVEERGFLFFMPILTSLHTH